VTVENLPLSPQPNDPDHTIHHGILHSWAQDADDRLDNLEQNGGAGGFGGTMQPFPIPGRWYTGTPLVAAGQGVSIESVVPKFSIVPVPHDITVDAMGIWVKTGTTSTGVARLAIYTLDTATGRPQTLILDAGEVSTETSGVKTIVLAQPLLLPAGFYAFGVSCNQNVTIEHEMHIPRFGSGSLSDNVSAQSVRTSWLDQFPYAPWPSEWTNNTEWWTAVSPRIGVRVEQ
jgi:hypothetical protein